MRATSNLHEPFFHPHGHSLIEDETLSLPMFVPKLLLVGRNPACGWKTFLNPLLRKSADAFSQRMPPVHDISTVSSFKFLQLIDVLR